MIPLQRTDTELVKGMNIKTILLRVKNKMTFKVQTQGIVPW
jgi:hypothetical protein